ncbi:MAG: sodium:proton antiporter [Rickettsiales bacterium]|nr:MAG: sodium:proton antiporter [Rickettsiales bacterium]
MTNIQQDIIYNITGNIFFSDNSSVKSRSSNVILNGKNLGFSIDITNIDMTEAEKVRTQVIQKINEQNTYDKVNIVLTSNRAKASENKPQTPKIHIEGVKNIILVASGKGGVGKSTIAALLAYKLQSLGKKIGIVDADIYGPSIPSIFAINELPQIDDKRMVPLQSHGILLNSIGFISAPDSSISWRGPMASKALYQLLSLTKWENLDYLIIDSPPGTGDVHLSLLQNYIIDHVIMVTTPQKVSADDVTRAINLYRKFEVPILGIIENMSYYHDTKTNEKIKIFSGNSGQKISDNFNLPFITQVPISSNLSDACDEGRNLNEFTYLLNEIDKFLP